MGSPCKILIEFKPDKDFPIRVLNYLLNTNMNIGEFKIINLPYLESHPDFDLLKWIQDGLQDLQYIEDRRRQRRAIEDDLC